MFQYHSVIDQTGHPNLALQFDLYHTAMVDLTLVDTYQRHVGRMGHIQFENTPGRHERRIGIIDFDPILAAIRASTYDGWIAAEYFSVNGTRNRLNSLKTAR